MRTIGIGYGGFSQHRSYPNWTFPTLRRVRVFRYAHIYTVSSLRGLSKHANLRLNDSDMLAEEQSESSSICQEASANLIRSHSSLSTKYGMLLNKLSKRPIYSIIMLVPNVKLFSDLPFV